LKMPSTSSMSVTLPVASWSRSTSSSAIHGNIPQFDARPFTLGSA
jgi:hypothetical protein